MLKRLVFRLHQTQDVGALDVEPGAPAKWISKPESTQITPISLQVASAQLRGQPDTASLSLAGVQEPHMNFSMRMPSPVESCVPKRHQSEPTQVFTVRRPWRKLAGNKTGLAEVGPDRGEVLLLEAQQVDALAARHFHHRDFEFVHHIGDGAKLRRTRHAAPHARHDGIGAVLWILAWTRSLMKRDW